MGTRKTTLYPRPQLFIHLIAPINDTIQDYHIL